MYVIYHLFKYLFIFKPKVFYTYITPEEQALSNGIRYDRKLKLFEPYANRPLLSRLAPNLF